MRIVFQILLTVFVANAYHRQSIYAKEYPDLKWVMIHYHKTGHNLVQAIMRSFKPKCNGRLTANWLSAARKKLSEPFEYDLNVLTSPQLDFNWTRYFDRGGKKLFRIVHFVRDPYEMIMSAFNYHSQIPFPETWIGNIDFNPCADIRGHNATGGDFPYQSLASTFSRVSNSTQSELEREIKNVQLKCKEMYTKYHQPGDSYHSVLQKTKASDETIFDGIMIEAMRSMINVGGGDILRMGANIISSRGSSEELLKTYSLNAFPIGKIDQFTETTTEMFRFLTRKPHEIPPEKLFFNCLHSVNSIVKGVVKEAYVDNAPSGAKEVITKAGDTKVKSVHVTQGLMSSEDKAKYMKMLSEENTIAPLLNIVKEAVGKTAIQ
jgi:hypothetical protein